jgi:hypothetical protein
MKAGTDLMAIQARGTLSCAAWYMLRGQRELSRIYLRRGEKQLEDMYRRLYDETAVLRRHRIWRSTLFSGTEPVRALLYYRALRGNTPRITRKNYMKAWKHADRGIGHVPEILWSYGLKKSHDRAQATNGSRAQTQRISGSQLLRRGRRGDRIDGHFSGRTEGRVATLSGLSDTAWCKMCHVPVCGTLISVRHDGDARAN